MLRSVRPGGRAGPCPNGARASRFARAALAALLLLAAVLPAAAADDEAGPPPDADALLHETWRWVRFDETSGLPSARVHHLLETVDGVTWAATQNGVAWFDGFRWNAAGPAQGLPPARASALAPADAGRVHVIVGGRLHVGGRAGFHEVPLRLAGRPMQAISVAATEDGRTLLTVQPTVNDPAVLVERTRDGALVPVAVPADLLTGAQAQLWSSSSMGRSGTLWLGAHSGLYEMSAGAARPLLARPGARFVFGRFAEGGDGTRYVCVLEPRAERGLWAWAPGATHGVRVDDQPAAAMAAGPRGEAVAAFDSGELRMREGGVFRCVEHPPREFQSVLALAHRANGDLWVATGSGLHLHRRAARLWERRRHALADPRNSVNEFLRRADGSLWVGTSGGVVVHDAGGGTRTIDRVGGQPVLEVTALAEDADGAVWLASGSGFAGAWRFDGASWRHFGAEDGLGAALCHRIAKDRSGRLWFLGLAGSLDELRVGDGPGAYCWDGSAFTRWSAAEGLLDGHVYAFAEGPDGALWFGTRKGLSRWRAGSWRHWTAEDGLRLPKVWALAIDASGRPWFAQQEAGLGYLDDDGVPRAATHESPHAPREDVWDVRVDAGGDVWATSWGGLWHRRDGEWSALGAEAGLDALRLWPVLPCRDRVYVGSSGAGVYVLDLAAQEGLPPKATVLGAVVDPPRALVRWTAASWWGQTPASRIRTRWRVDGGAWSPYSHEREVTLEDLDPGPHVVEVQARGVLGRDGAPSRTRFVVPEPLHRRAEYLVPVALLTAALVALGIALAVRRTRHARAMRRAEQNLRQFADHLDGVVWMTTADKRRILYVGPAYERIWGATTASLYERPASWMDAIHPEDRARVKEASRTKQLDGTFDEEFRIVRPDGSVRWIRDRAFPIREEDGTVVRITGIAEDVTERHATAEALRRNEEDLRQAQKMEAIGRLAGGVAHDFNNLLTVISGFTELARNRCAKDPQTCGHLDQITAAATRAAAMTKGLLAFGRRQSVAPAVVDVAELVRSTRELAGRMVGPAVQIVTDAGQEPAHVRADPNHLVQVLLNLVANARDAMPGGGQVTISVRAVEEPPRDGPGGSDGPSGPCVRISVVDTGVGMDDATLARTFEPFFTTKKGAGRGAGLGLSTVYGLVKQAGGAIAVTSRVGVGTRFTILLPRVDAPAAAPGTPAAPARHADAFPRDAGPAAPAPADAEAESRIVLLVDDEDGVRKYVADVLRAEGYGVLTARDADEAIEKAASFPARIDLLLTDVGLPRVDGRELARRFVATHPATRVAFLSGYLGATSEDDLLVPEGAHFLAKPFQAADLRALLARVWADVPEPEPMRTT